MTGMPSAGPTGVPAGFQQQQPQTGGPFGPVAGGQPSSSGSFSNAAGPRYGAAGAAPNANQGSFSNIGLSGPSSPNNGVFGNPGLGLNPNRSEGPSS